MSMAVTPYFVPFRRDAIDDRGVSLGPKSGQKECCANTSLTQQIENTRGQILSRAVIKGQCQNPLLGAAPAEAGLLTSSSQEWRQVHRGGHSRDGEPERKGEFKHSSCPQE